MDDILTGEPSQREAQKLQTSLINTLKKAQFDLRQWTFSEPRVTLSLLPEYREVDEDLEFFQDTHTTETQGIVWKPKFDVFHLKYTQLNKTIPPETLTKRQVLSDIPKTFDLSGWISPHKHPLEKFNAGELASHTAVG